MLTLVGNFAAVFGGLGIMLTVFLYACYKERPRHETFSRWLMGWLR